MHCPRVASTPSRTPKMTPRTQASRRKSNANSRSFEPLRVGSTRKDGILPQRALLSRRRQVTRSTFVWHGRMSRKSFRLWTHQAQLLASTQKRLTKNTIWRSLILRNAPLPTASFFGQRSSCKCTRRTSLLASGSHRVHCAPGCVVRQAVGNLRHSRLWCSMSDSSSRSRVSTRALS